MKGDMEIEIEVWANVEDCIAVVKRVDGPNQLELQPDQIGEICKEKNKHRCVVQEKCLAGMRKGKNG